MNLLLSKYALETSQESLSLSDTTFYIAKLRDSLNSITHKEYLQAELQYQQSKAEVYKNQISYNNNLRALLNYLNMAFDDYIVNLPQWQLPFSLDEATILEDAVANNPLFVENEISRVGILKNIYEAKINKGFNTRISISYGLNQYGLTVLDAYKKPTERQSLSIGLNIPIINWGISKNNYQSVKLKGESASIDIETSEKRLFEELKINVNEYNYVSEMLLVANNQKNIARSQYKLLVDLFKIEEATLIELATARIQYMQAMEYYYKLVVQNWTTYYKIREITLLDY
jgi:Outer membrane protein